MCVVRGYLYVWDTVGLYALTITVNTYTIFINVSSRIQCPMQVVRIQWLVWSRSEGGAPDVSAQCVCAM